MRQCIFTLPWECPALQQEEEEEEEEAANIEKRSAKLLCDASSFLCISRC